MNKRIIATLLALLMLAPALFACGKNKEPDLWQTVKIEKQNYNNVHNSLFSRIEAAAQDTVFYYDWYPTAILLPGTMATKLCAFDGESHVIKKDTYSSSDILVGDFAIEGNDLYYTANGVDPEDTDPLTNERTYLYRYDRIERKSEEVFSVNSYTLDCWMVCGDLCAYSKYGEECYIEDIEGYAYGDDDPHGLFLYDMEKERTTDICEDIWSFSFVDGALRYVTLKDGTFSLWEYDTKAEKSLLLGSFDGKMAYDDELYEESLHFNFTKDKLIFSGESRDYAKYYVYTIENGLLKSFVLPAEIDTLIAAEDYAYALCYDTDRNSWEAVFDEASGIYRISLADNTYEKINFDISEFTYLFVANDNDLYIAQDQTDGLLVEKCNFYRFNAESGEVKLLFED